MSALHRPAGSLAAGPYAIDLSAEEAGWGHAGLRVLELGPGAQHELATASHEVLVLPLAGSCVVECDGEKAELAGRRDVFSAVTDLAYAPPGSHLTISSAEGGRFAIPSALARAGRPFRHQPAAATQVELRGAGTASRQVNNLGTPAVLDAERLIACEVLTPGGNWSSYPPHKHDEERHHQGELVEAILEEIYYFEVAPGPGGPGRATAGVAYQRGYGTADRPLDLLAEVRTGDVVLVPHGWHGPSMAAPGYDLYYLNVMAGPGSERAWRICDDPAHTWVRDTWPTQQLDPRLPLYESPGRSA
jgi:5-deoxy-glucuronate isomerase